MRTTANVFGVTVSLALAVGGSALGAGLVSADGKFVTHTVPAYDEDGNLYNELFVRATDGGSTKTLGRAAGQRDQVCWIGSDRVAVSEFSCRDPFLVFEVTGKRLPDIVLPAGCEALYKAISPDGQKVAFTGSRQTDGKKRYGLFVCDVQGDMARLLIEKNIKTLAAWSPDSRRLALGTGAGYGKDHPLQIVDVTTGTVEDTGVLGVGASWSPDGKLIACTTAVQGGGSWFAGVPTNGKLGIYNVEQRQMRVIAGTDGALQPAWSRSGKWVAYLAGGRIGIASPDGDGTAIGQQPGRAPIQPPVQMGWVGDETLFIQADHFLARFDVSQAKLETVAKWDEPKAPELRPEDFKVLELPRVTVRYARLEEKYAMAFGRILEEAIKAYELHGFKMPQKATLKAQIDPASTALWTDGESRVFLHLRSKELLAPASRTGVFNIYGMCHELGHIAMYRNLESLRGLPRGVAEGWAHYAGSVVVTEVVARLGKSTWPEYYDIADVEGIGRLKRAAAATTPWDELDDTSRAALVFYRLETEYGRDKLAAAMTAALAERPIGKALMPLVREKLRTITCNTTAADWIPESVLVPHVEWQTKERSPGEDFFADQSVEKDGAGLWLFYDHGRMTDKLSMSGAAATVLFRLPAGAWQLDGVKLFSARYGTDEPPKEDISIYICDESFNLRHEVKVPYSNFEKGDEKWQSVLFPPIEPPRTFYLGVDFHATATKGVYVGMDKGVGRSHSRIAMPDEQVGDLKTKADWMLRAHLSPKK